MGVFENYNLANITEGMNKKIGLNMQNFLMNKNFGLLTGAGTPQELPWFKGFQEQINKQKDIQVNQLFRDAMARGIRGGSLEQLLQQPVQGGIQNIIRSILGQYQQAGSNTAGLADTAFKQWAQKFQLMLEYQKMKNKQAQQQFANKMGTFSTGLDVAKDTAAAVMGGMV